jgi:formylglycine-generating enzyme required for sulfatase activity
MIGSLRIMWLGAVLTMQAADINNSVGMKMMPIAPGEFVMGQDGIREESPAHKVKITKPFALAATEVTRGQWRAVMGAEPPDMGLKDQTDQHPVVGVTWFEAVAFCAKLSAKEGKTYRLPTEAEWEYACRAGTTTAYWFGEKPDLANMVCEADPPKDRSKPFVRTRHCPATVAGAPPNAWGLHDMQGNVHEWCYDFFHGESCLETAIARFMDALPQGQRAEWANSARDMSGHGFRPDCPTGEEYERKLTLRLAKSLETTLVDPLGPDRGQAGKRTIRGGGWGQSARYCRSAARMGADPLWRNQAIGFRVLREESTPGLSAAMTFPLPPGEIEVPGHGRLPDVVVAPAGMRFLLLRPGTFLMGISPQEAEVIKRGNISSAFPAGPQRRVTFTRPCYLAATMYPRAITPQIGRGFDDDPRNLAPPALHPQPYEQDRPHTQPMYDAIDLMLVMSLRDGRNYRLPTEPEMEYATRAGTTTAWYWGDDASVYFDYEFLRGAGEGDQPRHVGRKRPNPWGFYDMLCNSTQWTATPADAQESWPDILTDPAGDPIGRPTAAHTVYARRGMGYRYQMAACGATQLLTKFGNYRNCTRVGGFRLAFDAAELRARPVDEAWRKHITALRVANFVAAGNYGLTHPLRVKLPAAVNGAEGAGGDAVRYYRLALALDPGCAEAQAGLRKVRDELLPYFRQKPESAAAVEEVARQIEAALSHFPAKN